MEDTKPVIYLFGILGIFAAMALGIIWGGYVFSVLWGWFIVTAFAAPPLTIAQATGVSLAVRFLSARHKRDSKEDSEPLKNMLDALLVPLLFLAVGWLVKQWLPS